MTCRVSRTQKYRFYGLTTEGMPQKGSADIGRYELYYRGGVKFAAHGVHTVMEDHEGLCEEGRRGGLSHMSGYCML